MTDEIVETLQGHYSSAISDMRFEQGSDFFMRPNDCSKEEGVMPPVVEYKIIATEKSIDDLNIRIRVLMEQASIIYHSALVERERQTSGNYFIAILTFRGPAYASLTKDGQKKQDQERKEKNDKFDNWMKQLKPKPTYKDACKAADNILDTE